MDHGHSSMVYRQELRRRLLSTFSAVGAALDRTQDDEFTVEAREAFALAQQEISSLKRALSEFERDLARAGLLSDDEGRASMPSWPGSQRHSHSVH